MTSRVLGCFPTASEGFRQSPSRHTECRIAVTFQVPDWAVDARVKTPGTRKYSPRRPPILSRNVVQIAKTKLKLHRVSTSQVVLP